MSIVQNLMSRFDSAESAGIVPRFLSVLRRHRMQWMSDLASPPDADVLCATLDVEKRACTDGRNNLPPATETGITGSQRDIVDYHRRLQARARSRVEKLAARLTAAARRVNVSEAANRLSDVPSKCRNRLDRVLVEYESKDSIARQDEKSVQQNSKDRGGENAEADSGRFAATAILIVLMLVVLGTATLALGSDLLWGEALLYIDPAFGIAAITVVVPFMIGVSVSNQPGVPFSRKRPAFRIAILLTAAFLIVVASFCAHLIIGSMGAQDFDIADAVAAMNAMTSDPGAIGADVNALKGFGIVLVMGSLGFLLGNKAVGADEVNDSARMGDRGAGEYSNAKAAPVRKRINKIIDAAEKEVDRSVKRLQKQFNKLSRLAEQAKDAQLHYDNYLAALEESCNLLLERYREVNAAERNADLPASFAERICFRMEGASPVLFFGDGIERQQQSDDEMKALHGTVAEIRQNLRDLNRVAIRTLHADELHRDADEAYADSSLEPVSG